MYDHDLFTSQVKRGKPAEIAVEKYLLTENYNAVDVTDNINYQKQDIDFLVNHLFDDVPDYTLEVKGDYRMGDTGNFLLEVVSGDRDGFFVMSKADKLAFVDMKYNYLYIMDFDELRKYVQDNKATIPYRGFNLEYYKEAYLLSIAEAERNIKSFRKIILA
jgi:hypothetical protein